MIYGLIFLNHRTSAIAQRQSIVQFAENKGYTIDDFLSYSDLLLSGALWCVIKGRAAAPPGIG